MAGVNLDNINTVVPSSSDKRQFKVSCNERFTTSGQNELNLRCESESVRNKWLANLHKVVPSSKFCH